ncbi:hypothetical protein SAMN04487898_108157 [Pedobacter sp. ok626]|uniref:hypothetical protein n=1 Tax=Pedobacter sp. ok626 TaxID=1761882 RepID=UPI00087F61B5|nr:hypothetical protein [Pedobacter sp. ok626]SDK43357.1 hypothetical protein SAMN04487898_108157 [Pedobacter sp. ok626]
MKHILYALGLSVLLFSCKEQETTATYTPRILTANEKFNESYDGKDSIFTILLKKDQNTSEIKEEFNVKFKDTLVKIQVNKADPNSATDKFASTQFINTQKTALLVQLADNSGLAAPSYIIALKNGKLNVVSLYRASNGKEDTKYTTGINKLGRAGYLVNNDFFITNVNANVNLVKRQNPEERIQGEFILNSPDKTTLVFLTPSSLYQVHYPSDEVVNEKLAKPAPQSDAELTEWVKNNYIWAKNKKGITFLKFHDSDRIVDIKEFQ